MLVLARHATGQILIFVPGRERAIRLAVLEIRRAPTPSLDVVKLGFDAETDIRILREEIARRTT